MPNKYFTAPMTPFARVQNIAMDFVAGTNIGYEIIEDDNSFLVMFLETTRDGQKIISIAISNLVPSQSLSVLKPMMLASIRNKWEKERYA